VSAGRPGSATKSQKVRRHWNFAFFSLCLLTGRAGVIEYLNNRIESFRKWLKERPEQNIVVVGHSNFFRKFTGMKDKLANCQIHLHHL
jgi:hypothetical protein